MSSTVIKRPFSSFFELKDKLPYIHQILSSNVINHITFWLLLFLFNTVTLGYLDGTTYENVICFLLRIPFILVASYINLYFLLPRFYYKNRLFTYIISLLVLIIIVNSINMIFLDELLTINMLPVTMGRKMNFTLLKFGYTAFYMMTMIGLTSGIKLSKDHYIQKQKAEMMEKERLTSELSMLKSQMQPHFFFNTLNNLYALTLKKSDLAPEVVLKLSELMSYLLYDTDNDTTSLIKEISYIKNYIDLESLRFEQPPEVNFEIIGNCDQVCLPPVLLLPFIENSFKHSVKSLVRPIRICIQLHISAENFKLKVTNPYAEPVSGQKGGIGLRNVKRRLDLIYGDSYMLSQNHDYHIFKTELEIPIL